MCFPVLDLRWVGGWLVGCGCLFLGVSLPFCLLIVCFWVWCWCWLIWDFVWGCYDIGFLLVGCLWVELVVVFTVAFLVVW